MSSSAATIIARSLSQGYRKTLVVDALDLELQPGVVGLLGPNGAGKTTLLETLATIRRPQSGRLEILGVDAMDRRRVRDIRRNMGLLPQAFGYIPHFTVREFVTYCAWLREVPRQRRAQLVAAALDAVELGVQDGCRMRSLSGGMLRRVGIAQAIVNEPKLIIMDEPTVGLDPEQRLTFRRMIKELGQRSLVIIATHLVDDVVAACDDVILLFAGAVIFRGAPDALAAAAPNGTSGHSETIPGSAFESGYARLVARARRADA